MAHVHYNGLSNKSTAPISRSERNPFRKEMSMRILVTILGLGLSAALVATASTASAAGDDRCSALPQQVRSALASADEEVATRAARRLRTGEALCKANNARAAAKEFQVALKLLGATGGTALAGK
jgi:hypothetical protein